MKQYLYTVCFIGFLLSLVGCQDDNHLANGDTVGYLQISSVVLDKSITPQTKSSNTKTVEKLALEIIKDGQVVKHADDWKSLQGENIVLPVGDYLLRAYSSEKDSTKQGVSAGPFYKGETTVTLVRNTAKPVEVVCALAQAMVSVTYSKNFQQTFPDYNYECLISNDYGDVRIPHSESRPAYLLAGTAINTRLILTDKNGKTIEYPKQIVEKSEKKYHYKINFDVGGGTGDFTITVDESVQDYKVNIVVPMTPSSDSRLQTLEANAWGKFAYLYGTVDFEEVTESVKFQYKESALENWITVDAFLVDGIYSAKTPELDFSTNYDYRIAYDNSIGNTVSFTTERFEEIPNLNLDTWAFVETGFFKKKTWYPNLVADGYEADGAYWATGNPGVTLLTNSNTIPVDDAVRGKAAQMKTISMLVVGSAAGNLFIGKFNPKPNTSKPELNVIFGRPYSGARPLTLSGYYKYESESEDIDKGEIPGNLKTDECHIYIKLWDNSDKEIGYGEFYSNETIIAYTPFNIKINYSDPVSKPAKITIVATSSRYGGVFEGSKVVGQVGKGSTLWVDELELSYY